MSFFSSFLSPSREQVTSYLFTGLKFVGGALAARGVTVSPDIWALLAGPEAVTFYSGLVMTLLPMIRDGFTHSDAGRLVAASTVAGIKPIEVLPEAAPSVQAVADDKSVPMVKPAVAVYTPPTPSQRK